MIQRIYWSHHRRQKNWSTIVPANKASIYEWFKLSLIMFSLSLLFSTDIIYSQISSTNATITQAKCVLKVVAFFVAAITSYQGRKRPMWCNHTCLSRHTTIIHSWIMHLASIGIVRQSHSKTKNAQWNIFHFLGQLVGCFAPKPPEYL